MVDGSSKVMRAPKKTTKDEEIDKLRRELDNLRKRYNEKCVQLDNLQNEDILLRRIQELLSLQEQYQKRIQEQNEVIQTLKREKLNSEAQRSALESLLNDLQTQLQECQQNNHTILQTAWQEALQIMEEDYKAGQKRIQELEQRVAELQEQVLAQAQQKNEYEAALQYLQEQSLHFQSYAHQLSSALERLFEEHREWKKAEIPYRIDLPSFLVKNRSHLC